MYFVSVREWDFSVNYVSKAYITDDVFSVLVNTYVVLSI